MEGSSESAWQKSDSFRGFSTVSNRNTRSASHDSGFRKETNTVVLARQNLENQAASFSGVCEDEVSVDPFVRTIEWSEVSLRQWLDKPERSVDEFECLHIFRQIIEIVNMAHSQGIVVHNVRPSCFVMSSFNHVSFIESASCSDSGSDSFDDGLNGQTVDNKSSSSSLPNEMCQQRSRLESEHFHPVSTPTNTLSEASCMQNSSVYAADVALGEETEENKIRDTRNVEQEEERKQPFPMKQILLMESSWYTSPEEVDGSPGTCDSDIYRLGVLLFEVCNENTASIMLRIKIRMFKCPLLFFTSISCIRCRFYLS